MVTFQARGISITYYSCAVAAAGFRFSVFISRCLLLFNFIRFYIFLSPRFSPSHRRNDYRPCVRTVQRIVTERFFFSSERGRVQNRIRDTAAALARTWPRGTVGRRSCTLCTVLYYLYVLHSCSL